MHEHLTVRCLKEIPPILGNSLGALRGCCAPRGRADVYMPCAIACRYVLLIIHQHWISIDTQLNHPEQNNNSKRRLFQTNNASKRFQVLLIQPAKQTFSAKENNSTTQRGCAMQKIPQRKSLSIWDCRVVWDIEWYFCERHFYGQLIFQLWAFSTEGGFFGCFVVLPCCFWEILGGFLPHGHLAYLDVPSISSLSAHLLCKSDILVVCTTMLTTG